MNRVVAFAWFFLGACTVGPDYVRPELEAPATWASLKDSAPAQLAKWWTLFKDPILDSLVRRAILSNLDIKIATARVREAKAEARIAGASFWPDLDGTGYYQRSRFSQNGFFGNVPISPERDMYHFSLDANWEVDVFGRVSRGAEAATADAQAAMEDQRAVLVSLLGEVARNYVEVRASQKKMGILRKERTSAQETLDLAKARLQAGLGTELDVARSEALVASVVSDLPPVQQSNIQAIHRLGVLLGLAPGALIGELSPEGPFPVAPVLSGAGLPSELLRRRPDLARAERNLAAATARVGVATAELYPKISLSGSVGVESQSISSAFDWASRLYSAMAGVLVPIFHGDRIRANIDAFDARREQALLGFQRAFLLALEEAENSLASYFREHERAAALAQAVAANQRALEQANDLYSKGLTNFLDVLDAQRTLYSSQAQLGNSEAAVATNLVSVYKTLGGGWETEP